MVSTSLELRVLRLGCFRTDVGVGVFPEREEPLLRQADAAQEVLKARIGTQAVEPGIR